jgi:hypothetical protein
MLVISDSEAGKEDLNKSNDKYISDSANNISFSSTS